MSARTIPLVGALLIFLYQTAVVLSGLGYQGFVDSIGLNEATKLMFLDLTIALVLIMVWMYDDAAARWRTVLPYFIVTVLFGIAGPLLYLLMRRRPKTAGVPT